MFIKTIKVYNGKATKLYIEPEFKHIINNECVEVVAMLGAMSPLNNKEMIAIRDGTHIVILATKGNDMCKVCYPMCDSGYRVLDMSHYATYETSYTRHPWCIVEVTDVGMFMVWSNGSDDLNIDPISEEAAFALLGEKC